MKNNRRALISVIWVILGIALNVAVFVAGLDEFWSGVGTAFVFVGVLQLIRWGKYSRNSEYRTKVDVEINDERNRYLALKAWGWAGYMFVIICAVASIVLRILGNETLSTVSSMGVCLVLILYWVSYFVLKRKY